MTKRDMIKAGLAIAAAMVVMTGCGNSTTETTAAGNSQNAVAETTVAESVGEHKIKLGEYKGLKHTVVKDEVTSGEVEAQLHNLAVQYPPKITDRAAELGDKANIDYVGTLDGVEFSGGTAYSHDLELGSGTFIAGFEEGVVGMMPGEEKDLPLTFPEEYHNADLAGKAVVFHVKLNHVTNLDTITVDDGLAQRAMYKEDATLDMLRAQTREKMELNAEVYYYLESAAELLEQVVANSEIELDQNELQNFIDETVAQYTAQAMLYGMDYKSFTAAFLNSTPEQVEIDLENSLKEEIVMNAIVAAENIEATDEQKEMLAKINNCDSVEKLTERYGEEQVEKMCGMYAGTYFLISNAVKAE